METLSNFSLTFDKKGQAFSASVIQIITDALVIFACRQVILLKAVIFCYAKLYSPLASCGKYNMTLTASQNITQETCISLLATRLKIQLILFNYCGKDKAHYISPKAKYSGLHFYFEFKSLWLLQLSNGLFVRLVFSLNPSR